MDPISIIVASAIALFKPYVSRGVEEFAKEAGKDAYQATKELFSWVKTKLEDNEESSRLVSLFEAKPERYEQPLKEILEEKAILDPKFAADLRDKIQGMSPFIHIVQRMGQAKNVIGAIAGEIRDGSLELQQDFTTGEDIIGLKVDKIGR